MIVLSAKNLSKVYGTDVILEKVSFHVNEGDRVGIIGKNGAGKSTLMNMLTGELSCDDGEFFVSQNTRIGYLKQRENFNGDRTVIEEVTEIFGDLLNMEKDMEEKVRKAAAGKGFYFMTEEEAGRLAKLLFKPNGTLNPQIVGKSAVTLAQMAGFSVPQFVKVLVAREQEAGPTRPYSMEKLCPVLALFVMDREDAVLEKAIEVLKQEGSGHTFAMHATDAQVVRKFALQIPVSRFLVNTPAALGGIGATTPLFPALTLGCGAVGGSASSNNISPMDLINIRRVAWDSEETLKKEKEISDDLVQIITAKILERLK